MRWILLFALLLPVSVLAKSEADYVQKTCKGQIEYALEDRTRVDCLTELYAIEYDFCPKWAEAIGQSLHYARMTGKHPAIVLICDTEDEIRHIMRVWPLAEDLGINLILQER